MKKKLIFVLGLIIMACLISSTALAVNVLQQQEGDIFEIRLLENPSTGYFWHLYTEQDDSFKILNTETEFLNTDKAAAGSPALKTWIIQVDSSGVIEICFKLHRKEAEARIVDESKYLIAVDVPVIQLGKNEVEKISLVEKIDSGYRWHKQDNDIVDFLKVESVEFDKNNRLKNFYFKTTKSAISELEFKLYQSWEKEEVKAVKKYLIIGN